LAGNSSSAPVAQVKPSIDVRDIPGVDCTAATDSSTGLNTLFTNISNKRVTIPNGCQLKVVAAGLLIQGQTNFILEGNGHQPFNAPSNAAMIGGCNGTVSGPVLTINQSAYFELRDFGVVSVLTGHGCSSSGFNQGVLFTNTGSGGYTPTYAKFRGLTISPTLSGGTWGANWIGFEAGTVPNLEQVTLEENIVTCNNSPNSYGIWANGGNADDFKVINNRIGNCFHGIHAQGDSITATGNHLSGNGNYSIFGANGAAFYLGGMSYPVNILANDLTDGGPFINSATDCTDGNLTNAPINIEGNYIAPGDIDTSQYIINAGCSAIPITLRGNHISTYTVPKAVIGNSANSGATGAYGQLIAQGNYWSFNTDHYPWQDAANWQWGTFEPDLGLNTFDLAFGYRNAFPANGYGGPRSAALTLESSTLSGIDDFGLVNIPNGASATSSTLVLDHHAGNSAANTYVAIQPQLAGSVTVSAVSNPSIVENDSILPVGTSGAATWSYKLVGISGGGCTTAASSAISTSSGNATLTSSNYNAIYYIPDPGMIAYEVYRTASGGTPSTTGLIGTFYLSQEPQAIRNAPNFKDTGLAGDSSTPPSTNTCTGIITAPGGFVGNASSATALASTPSQCSGGTPLSTGIAANGNANCVSGTTWSAIANPAADLSLSMGNHSSTFNHTSAVPWVWANVTPATSGGGTLIASGAGANYVSMPTLNTAGANFLVAVVQGYGYDATITSNPSNTWHYTTAYASGSYHVYIAYAYNANVSASQTFTLSGGGSGGVGIAQVFAFANMNTTSAVLDAQNGISSGLTSPFQVGSISPTAGDLVIAGFNCSVTGTVTASIGSSFTGVLVSNNNQVGDAGAGAYLLSAPGGALNPTWTTTHCSSGSAASVIAAFVPAPAVSQSSPIPGLEGQYYNGSTSAPDIRSWQNVLGSGPNPSSTVTETHTGTTGPLVTQYISKINTIASATGNAGLNLPPGTAPTSPVNGDCWTTTAGFYCQINGATVGPYGASLLGTNNTFTGTNAFAAVTATSLLASGIVSGQAPVTITTAAACTDGVNSTGCPYAAAYNSGYTLNQEATAATAVIYTLPTPASGIQKCYKNSNNGSAADTGTIELLVANTGTQSIIYNGTASSSGYIISGGAAGDAACLVGISATQWEAYVQVGTWTLH
jgi:hypothetical protein